MSKIAPMHSEVLIVATPGRLPRLECRGGIAARRTGPDTVHLVSAAATPLGGDTVTVRVVVEPGARLRVRSVAATIVLPGAATTESSSVWRVEAAGAVDIDPQPTVVAGAARHPSSTEVRLTGAGRLRMRERVQIGRSGEQHGFWSGAWYADVDSAPLLRHRVELGAGSVTSDALGTPLASVSELRYPEQAVDTDGTVLELAAGGCLATWQGERL